MRKHYSLLTTFLSIQWIARSIVYVAACSYLFIHKEFVLGVALLILQWADGDITVPGIIDMIKREMKEMRP